MLILYVCLSKQGIVIKILSLGKLTNRGFKIFIESVEDENSFAIRLPREFMHNGGQIKVTVSYLLLNTR